MLCGHPPFGGKNDEEIFQKIYKGEYVFQKKEWGNISDEAKELVTKMLTYDVEKRITSEEALNDNWIIKSKQKLTKQVGQACNSVLKNLKNFNVTSMK